MGAEGVTSTQGWTRKPLLFKYSLLVLEPLLLVGQLGLLFKERKNFRGFQKRALSMVAPGKEKVRGV